MNSSDKIRNMFAALAMTAVLSLIVACTPQGNASTSFWVRGNCEMCQERIVETIQAVPGVAEASYDLETHLAAVSFDSTKTNAAALERACATAGHETKAEKSTESAIQSLPKCCQPDGHM
ncbi:MAG: cation transporter [Bacteroidia bacterium]